MNAGDFIAIGVVGVGAIVILALPQTREWLQKLFGGGGLGVFDPLTDLPIGATKVSGNCTCTSKGCCWTSIGADGQKGQACVSTTWESGGCDAARTDFCKNFGPCTGQIGTAPAPGVYVDPKCTGVQCPTAHTHPIWVAAAGRCSCAWDPGYGPGAFIPKAISTNCIQVSPTLYQWISTPCTNNSKVLPSYFGPGLAGKVYGLGEGTTCAQAKSSYLTRCGVPNVPPGGTQSNTCINLAFGSSTRTACCQAKFPCAAGTHSVSSTSTLHGGCSCGPNVGGGTPPPSIPSSNTCINLAFGSSSRLACCQTKFKCPSGTHSVSSTSTLHGGCSCASNVAGPSPNPTPCKGTGSGALACCISHYGNARSGTRWSLNSNGACITVPVPKPLPTSTTCKGVCAGGLSSTCAACCRAQRGANCATGQHWSLNASGGCTCAANHAYIKSYAGQRSTGVFDYYDDPRISGRERQRRAYASQRSTGTFDFYNNRRTNPPTPPEHPETYQIGNRRNRLGRGLGDTMRANETIPIHDYPETYQEGNRRNRLGRGQGYEMGGGEGQGYGYGRKANATQRSTGVFDYYDQTSEERRRKAFAAQRSTGQFNYYYNRNKGGAVDLVNNVQFSGIGGIGG